ncbi:ATPase/kinase (plasmid) [Leptolyngbya sp. NIES-3755]|nr:ATPase/kinase [Leptolyngbya sp. NIES-3755]
MEDAAALQAHRFLFIDTNAMTTMFFSHYYNRNSLPALRELAAVCRSRYHHVFVCDDDIPFEQDGWRDSKVWRGRMQGMILYDLAVRGIEYKLLSGSLDDRI